MSAEQLGEMRETDEQAFDNVFQQANFKEYVFRVRAKVDTFNVSTGTCVCTILYTRGVYDGSGFESHLRQLIFL